MRLPPDAEGGTARQAGAPVPWSWHAKADRRDALMAEWRRQRLPFWLMGAALFIGGFFQPLLFRLLWLGSMAAIFINHNRVRPTKKTPGGPQTGGPFQHHVAFYLTPDHLLRHSHAGAVDKTPLEPGNTVLQYSNLYIDRPDGRRPALITGLPRPEQRRLYAAIKAARRIRQGVAGE